MYMRFQSGGIGHSFVPITNHDPMVEEDIPPELKEEPTMTCNGEATAQPYESLGIVQQDVSNSSTAGKG